MTRTITVSSPHGGTGKTSLVVNIAVVAAQDGLRVAIVDTAMQSPGLAAALGPIPARSLADYLCGDCDIADTAHHVPHNDGALFVVAACRGQADAVRALVGGYDPGLLVEACQRLTDVLDLDLLLLDTPAGLNTEAIVSIAVADVDLRVERALSPRAPATRSRLVINMLPESVGAPEAFASLPYSPEFAAAAPGQAFVTTHPEHEMSDRFRALTRALTGPSMPPF